MPRERGSSALSRVCDAIFTVKHKTLEHSVVRRLKRNTLVLTYVGGQVLTAHASRAWFSARAPTSRASISCSQPLPQRGAHVRPAWAADTIEATRSQGAIDATEATAITATGRKSIRYATKGTANASSGATATQGTTN